MAKQAIRKVLALPKVLKAKMTISSLLDGDYLIGDIPYQCQFATPNLTKDILENRLPTADDPNWKDFGFKTREEYEYWSWRCCGVCCVKMIFDYYGEQDSLAELVNEGVALGGYDVDNDAGWYYKPLLELANKHGLRGSISSCLSTTELARHIVRKQFVIASVSPTIIRMDETIQSKRKSGHLVLVVGFSINRGRITGMYIHNPSGKSPEMRKKTYIPIATFSAAYGGRGIVLHQ